MGDRQLAYEPQPETLTAASFRGRVGVALEDPQPIGGRDPRSVIANGDARARDCGLHHDANRTALTEFQRVGEEIADDLFDRGRVPPSTKAARRRNDGHALGAGERREQAFDRRTHGPGEVGQLRVQNGAAHTLQLGYRVDQCLEALHLRADHAEGRHHEVARETRRTMFRDADVQKGRRDRCVELVANQLHGVRMPLDVPMVSHPNLHPPRHSATRRPRA
jgi:hypothetical protein